MRQLGWLFPVAIFLLNPNLACGPSADEPEFRYGAEELRAAVEGEWTVTITPSSDSPIVLRVHLEQAAAIASTARTSPALIRSAHACGTRTLIRPAAACVDITQMPLTVTLLSGDPSLNGATLRGSFNVYGLLFTQGLLALELGPYIVDAILDAEGQPQGATLSGGGLHDTASLSR